MKKTYNTPETNVVEMKIVAPLLNYSSTEAAADAESLSREVDFGFDGE
jgi:hypothetical protein